MNSQEFQRLTRLLSVALGHVGGVADLLRQVAPRDNTVRQETRTVNATRIVPPVAS
jgi:hypothetical protein